MVGRGLFEPLTQMAPKAWTAGYVEGLDLRPYNPEKAKQLMADAGYDGEEIILFTREGDTPKDTLVAIQGYLQEVGFNVKLDISDRARYIEAIFREGWDGLAFCSSGLVLSLIHIYPTQILSKNAMKVLLQWGSFLNLKNTI